jgi:hypothetical protein
MGGAVPKSVGTAAAKKQTVFGPGVKKSDTPNLSVGGGGKASAPTDAIGLSSLGESTPPTTEGITTTTGSSPARKKKPTIVLLGEKP